MTAREGVYSLTHEFLHFPLVLFQIDKRFVFLVAGLCRLPSFDGHFVSSEGGDREGEKSVHLVAYQQHTACQRGGEGEEKKGGGGAEGVSVYFSLLVLGGPVGSV